jgi:alginate biosynthesis protein AlgX
MRFYLSLGVLTSVFLSSSAVAQPIGVVCPQLTDESAFAADIKSLAPLDLNPETGWILRDHDKMLDFGFSDEGVALMAELVRVLGERTGSQLVTIVPPPRALFAPNSKDQVIRRAQYSHLQAQLRATGAIVPDIFRAIEATPGAFEDYFYRSDTHWTPAGALLSAQAIALALDEAGILPEPPTDPKFVLTGELLPAERTGALLRAVEKVCEIELPGEIAQIPVIATVQPADTAAALFGDQDDEDLTKIVLLGTSFSSSDQFRWADSVSFALQRDVDNRSVSGGAFDSAFVAYAESDLYADQPELLIWEFLPHYIKPYLGARVRDILASVLGSCPADAQSTSTPIQFIDTEWGVELPVPSGHDILNLSLPGVDLGTVRFKLEVPDADDIRGLATRRDRVAEDMRSDQWSFYAAQATDSGMVATGGMVSFQVEGTDMPVDGTFTSCSSNTDLR